jgi:hypothetical protein
MKMPCKGVTAKVPPKAYALLSRLSEALRMPKRQVIAMAIEHLAKECGILDAKESDSVAMRQPPVQQADDPTKAVVADMLYLFDATLSIFDAILTTYPDLRTECSVPFAQLCSRFRDVAEAWGFVTESEEGTAGTGEKAGNEVEGSDEK